MFGEVLVVITTITFDGADDPLQLLALVAVRSAARAYLQSIIRTVFGKELHDKQKQLLLRKQNIQSGNPLVF